MSQVDETYPEHDRTSCSEDNPNINATAEGSTGCARCTALLLERERTTRTILEQYKYGSGRRDSRAVLKELLELHKL